MRNLSCLLLILCQVYSFAETCNTSSFAHNVKFAVVKSSFNVSSVQECIEEAGKKLALTVRVKPFIGFHYEQEKEVNKVTFSIDVDGKAVSGAVISKP